MLLGMLKNQVVGVRQDEEVQEGSKVPGGTSAPGGGTRVPFYLAVNVVVY